MSSIPNPVQAARLRTLYQDNPVIRRAVESLRAFGGDLDAATAARLLVSWAHFGDLSLREVKAVLAFFVPEVAKFPYDPASDRVLAAEAALDPDDHSFDAEHIRNVAEMVRDHREAQEHGNSGPDGAI